MQYIYIFNMSYVKHIADDQIIRSMQYIHISIGLSTWLMIICRLSYGARPPLEPSSDNWFMKNQRRGLWNNSQHPTNY